MRIRTIPGRIHILATTQYEPGDNVENAQRSVGTGEWRDDDGNEPDGFDCSNVRGIEPNALDTFDQPRRCRDGDDRRR